MEEGAEIMKEFKGAPALDAGLLSAAFVAELAEKRARAGGGKAGLAAGVPGHSRLSDRHRATPAAKQRAKTGLAALILRPPHTGSQT